MTILAVLCCYNRKQETKKCIESIVEMNLQVNFEFIVVDDHSSDGTAEMLEEMAKKYTIHIIRGNGKLYYSGGMRIGMDYALMECKKSYDYLLMLNDDVDFFPHCIERLIATQKEDAVIVGATCNKEGTLTYGAIKYIKSRGVQYKIQDISNESAVCDTFNANCVLIPYKAFLNVGSIDPHYVHSLGDFDYGLALRKSGYQIFSSGCYVGICNRNSDTNTWKDRSLPFRIRIRKKESPKGAPFKIWFYFLNKNFGLLCALRHSFTPFLRILFAR